MFVKKGHCEQEGKRICMPTYCRAVLPKQGSGVGGGMNSKVHGTWKRRVYRKGLIHRGYKTPFICKENML